MRRVVRRTVAVLGVLTVASLGPATPALAQEPDPVLDVEISFDVGSYDPVVDDWTIDAVEVTGDLEEGTPFTVELRDVDDGLVWTATQPYVGGGTRVEVAEPVAVSEVDSAGITQGRTVVGGVQVEPPAVDWSASGGGGSGQLALSMVMALIIVAIVFRSPLPSSSSERWTK